MTIAIVELTDSADDLDRLGRLYDQLFIPSFPDPDERESLENMKAYLTAKRLGWYESLGERNSYHILVAEIEGRPAAAAVFDYLAGPSVGILEFILVSEERRGLGIGSRMHRRVEEVLQVDARLAGHAALDGIVIEMNDPFQVDLATDNVDPFERARLWGHWNYEIIDFPYVQPALSADQGPVDYLLLCIRRTSARWQASIPGPTVAQIVYGYLKWAMRIDDPERNLEFQKMSDALAVHQDIQLTSLLSYVGIDASRPFEVMAITDSQTSDHAVVTGVYKQSFPAGDTTIDCRVFAATLERVGTGYDGLHYHLWGMREPQTGIVAGMASFFTLSQVGFGGYLTLITPLLGTGRCRLILSRIEEQMVRDRSGTCGWYIECDLNSTQRDIFCRLGFCEVPVSYLQPSLTSIDACAVAPSHEAPMALMYKPIGQRAFDRFRDINLLRADLMDIFRNVYCLSADAAASRLRSMIV